MKNCKECKYALFIDYGYSNYTVEGTNFECAINKHPDGEFDRFYGEDKRLDYAEQCDGFIAGESIEMDVDNENFADLSPEQKSIFGLKR